ncbi:OmpA family protein [Methylomonas sp. LL1]|uniref:OmpA family protein n=1 Tax=Methylomonas sp. LL1 TaxID=2785785 RepID=UPI0018C40A7C|nr:OmpA family protein [Methylomonas sp. LL1]QPK63672.1 OmpA family protein [Methylomonas sp. LL1]
MQKFLTLSAALTAALVSGCATQSSNTFQPFQANDLNAQVQSGLLVQKTNSFFVLNDSSSSTGKTYLNSAEYSGTKLDVEKNLLHKFNKSIPSIPLTSGLRSFGMGPCTDWHETKLNQPVQQYTAGSFESAITTMTCSSGGTPLAEALTAAKPDLGAESGNIALIVFSDGMDETNPVPAAQALKAQYGDKLCIYTVWVGNQNDAIGRDSLQQIADVSSCGMATDVNTISSPAGMSDFVKTVFLKPGTPIPDCSKLDDDKDGVNNCQDKCPNTLPGVEVSIHGCWILDVKFDNDKDIIKPAYYQKLDRAAEIIKKFPNESFEVQGHTSKTGSYEHNMDLSERRALAVKKYLTKNNPSTNISSKGYGWNNPIDTNETAEGQANNRRVQLEVNGQPQQPLRK